jgi:LuxR family transcriptional regulator, regulator of acetate metabolism
MLSRVEDETWMPWMAYFQHREIRESDREWMSSGRIPAHTMMLEREVLEEGQAAFTVDAHADPRISKEFVEATGTRSYAVAPIVPAGRVIGLIHADHYPLTRPVDEVDCHILGHFAEAFGRIYERAVLLARLHRQRDQVRETLKTAEEIMDSLAHAEVELVGSEDQRSSADAAATLVLTSQTPAIDELLTAREREVIALLVTGQTNSAIAERLVISEGTVKSHVKQILRKLGAVNRSEVIARYLGMIEA